MMASRLAAGIAARKQAVIFSQRKNGHDPLLQHPLLHRLYVHRTEDYISQEIAVSEHWTDKAFRKCSWIECSKKLSLYFVLWCVVGPAMLCGSLLLLGMMIDGVAQYDEDHDRCLKNATNGYEIKQCR
jgi:hypothetical protein